MLILAGQADKVVTYLKGKTFSYSEGIYRFRENIIDAQLSLRIKFYKAKNYKKTLEHFSLGLGYKGLNKRKQAKEDLKKSYKYQ